MSVIEVVALADGMERKLGVERRGRKSTLNSMRDSMRGRKGGIHLFVPGVPAREGGCW